MVINPDFAAVFFGLATALSWGTGDFTGGLATKRTSVFGVMLAVHGVGLILLLALALLFEPLPPVESLLWGLAAGLSGVVGTTALYQALASGHMGVNASIAAVLGAAVPVVMGTFLEGLPGPLKLIGFGLAAGGIWLTARPSRLAGRPEGLGLAALAGFGFAGFIVLIDQAGAAAVFWPLAAARLTSFVVMLLIVLRRLPGWRPSRAIVPFLLMSGALDVAGNVFFVLAAQTGRLDVSAVLASVATAVTLLLARAILKERLSRVQAIGVGIILIAIPLIAA